MTTKLFAALLLLALPARAGVEVCAVSALCPNGQVSACVITYALPRPLCWNRGQLGLAPGEYDDPPRIPPTLWPLLVAPIATAAKDGSCLVPWDFHASVLNFISKRRFPVACKYDAEVVLLNVSNHNH